ncbi:uncharacterized protein LOC135848007 [Planococcus citri]|uniref:uncharacterized protein LOC135848007 n=1 Tax=Planococcus citri TaxID=170843 RepID=UPI0031F9069B
MLQKCVLLFIVVLINLFFIIDSHKTKPQESCPYFPSTPPPYKAYSPINIITKNVIPANVSTPVNLRDGVLGPLFVINTGYAFEAYSTPADIPAAIIYGGVLCGNEYKFHKLRAYVSQDPNGRSFNQIDGKGSPLSIALHYYKAEYGSFEEGLKHPGDGVLLVNYMITHGPVYNIFFILPQIALLLFRIPGFGIYFAPAILLYAWFNIIFIINEYYAFYGSYLDLETGIEYPNVIQIQTAGIYPLLTKSQLKAFQSLISINGTLLETVAPLHTQNQPVYLGKGYTETYSLI